MTKRLNIMRKLVTVCAFALLTACNACDGPPPLTVEVVAADMGAARPPGHCPAHPGCGNPEDGGAL